MNGSGGNGLVSDTGFYRPQLQHDGIWHLCASSHVAAVVSLPVASLRGDDQPAQISRHTRIERRAVCRQVSQVADFLPGSEGKGGWVEDEPGILTLLSAAAAPEAHLAKYSQVVWFVAAK
jgi:hypothetical protein